MVSESCCPHQLGYTLTDSLLLSNQMNERLIMFERIIIIMFTVYTINVHYTALHAQCTGVTPVKV